jgi:signal transduction histidine kinase
LSNLSTNQIARQIHDGIAQDLVALGYQLDQSLAAPELPTSTRADLRALRFGVTELIEKVRREILGLRNEKTDLAEAAKLICGDRLGVFNLEVPLNPQLRQVVIELLRNAATHSGASLISLRTFQGEDCQVIEVSDDGEGGIEVKENRFGLVGISEAVAELSGKIEFIKLTPGLLIRVSIPN